ncbi:CaeNaCin (Caenorhabditis bacteriocin) [Caenorhabditis elegans]|uniref:CaeNaCin (Caenorhabditis bacteriocin) n=1 Tax=Caenorhabditis elegans TaxID=6239 RepID=Q4R175_CAEEL|nr:CaeNaCin (Caenorhabditis bacteriocin) [Caenorhabditis elegans]CCD83347.1 CaeNaCin (Caenorhabditis bacteriocin) [Caenorhabditis elegans]|eukprot:NP_001033500.1 CaeNaCin (Caenorhabditis bacteriocin) [Caenorhabditis elegans]
MIRFFVLLALLSVSFAQYGGYYGGGYPYGGYGGYPYGGYQNYGHPGMYGGYSPYGGYGGYGGYGPMYRPGLIGMLLGK